MFAGDRERFAIEAEVEEHTAGFVLGHIRFWICGRPVGNYGDTVDMSGCLHWLRDFVRNPRDRHAPDVCHLRATSVFRLLHDPVFSDYRTGELPIPDAYARFHISHLGMTAFERFDVLLVKDEVGRERCLWREADSNEIHDCVFDALEMERVASEFCDMLEHAIGTRSRLRARSS